MSSRGGFPLSRWSLLTLPIPVLLTVFFFDFVGGITAGRTYAVNYSWAPSLGVNLSFYLDGLSLLFALLICGIGSFIILYADGYMEGHPQLGRLQGFLLLFMLSMLGLVTAGNLILLFVFWELTSITSYLLIGFDHENAKARKSALQALFVTGAGGLLMLAGFILIGVAAGTYEISELGSKGDVLKGHALYLPILLLVLLGALTKSAQFPFHFWLPDAMAAPTPVSAYLHSATMVKAGIYLLARLHPEIGGTMEWMLLLKVTGGVTAIFASVKALTELDLKRILAYTTLMALGTLTMFLGADTHSAIAAAVTFLLVHSLYKSALFLMTGNLDHQTGSRRIDKLGGLAWYMPITAGVALAAGFAMAGFPPFLGFIGKELKYQGALALSTTPGLVAAASLTANALMTAVALTIAFHPFHGRLPEGLDRPTEAPFRMWLGPVVFAGLGLLFGVVPSLVARGVVRPVLRAVFGTAKDVDLVLFHGVNLPLVLSVVTLASGILVFIKIRTIRSFLQKYENRLTVSANGFYQVFMTGLVRLAHFQTKVIQSGSLRRYFFVVFTVFVVLTGGMLIYQGAWPESVSLPNVSQKEWALGFLILTAALAAALTDKRLVAVASLGLVGACAALIFALYGAPDVALTQLLVETLSLIILSMMLLRLPRLDAHRDRTGVGMKVARAALSLIAGGTITVLILTASSGSLDRSLTVFFEEHSLLEAHGRNIVNVILVDFRGLDTLGEITVVTVAGLSAWMLLRSGRRKEDL